jgi:phosphopantetheinyl transferase (holo-ACP synthase)
MCLHRIACKEAAFKAVHGLGIPAIGWRELVVETSNTLRKPHMRIEITKESSYFTKEIEYQNLIRDIRLFPSISHDHGFAAATVLALQNGPECA